jgi:hypothetical protein
VPADALLILDLVWKIENFHAVVVQWVWLRQVYDVESHFVVSHIVLNSVEEPLGVPISVYVILQD